MDAPIYFEGFENVPELREALIAYVERISRSMTLHEVCSWLPETNDENPCLNLP